MYTYSKLLASCAAALWVRQFDDSSAALAGVPTSGPGGRANFRNLTLVALCRRPEISLLPYCKH